MTAAGENINNLSGDIAGYFGDDPGDLMEVAAGSVVVFSALTLHGSGANGTRAPRRALNIAYTQSRYVDAGARKGVAFIKHGRITDEAARLRAPANHEQHLDIVQ